MSDEPPESSASEQPTGPEAEDQPTRVSPVLGSPSPPPPAITPPSEPGAASERGAPPATAHASDVAASPASEPDKAPRVETVPAAREGPASGGRSYPAKAASFPRDLTDKPEILVGAAFGAGVLLAIIIRRLGS